LAARSTTRWRIENYISVLETDGPKFAAALEAHTRAYDVDIMNLQLAEKLIPAAEPGGLIEVKLANGGSLKAKTVILSTGARWRNVNVPGEAEYKNKGVAYCPHCDGPLFKGKRVAVIGGGNSGVEAAIDLAGVVAHVTLIEFADQLKADAVLVNKLKSLPNVTGPHQRADHRNHRRRRQGQRPEATRTAPPARSTWCRWKACSCRSAWCPTPNGSRARWSCPSSARS
jgi:alkyl hydroperoxide reductase subunit AhpF